MRSLYSYWNSHLPSKSFFFFFCQILLFGGTHKGKQCNSCKQGTSVLHRSTQEVNDEYKEEKGYLTGGSVQNQWSSWDAEVDWECELLALPMWVEDRLSFFPFPLPLFGLWLPNNAGDSLRNHPKGRWTAVRVEVLLCFPVHHLSDFHLFHCISVWLIVLCLSWVS